MLPQIVFIYYGLKKNKCQKCVVHWKQCQTLICIMCCIGNNNKKKAVEFAELVEMEKHGGILQ